MSRRRVRPEPTVDAASADADLVRREAVRVGLWIALASALGGGVLLVALAVLVLRRVGLRTLLSPTAEPSVVLDAGDLLEAGTLVAVLAVLAAGIVGALAARRALGPLTEALARQRRFVADASHELRTPTAVLDARVQVLQRALGEDDPRRPIADALREDTRRLSGVITDMLAAVEEDLRPAPGGDEEGGTDAVLALRELCEDLAGLARDRGVELVCRAGEEPLPVPLPAARLQRLATALVDNALKQSPPGTRVEVEVAPRGRHVAITVRDQGPGIQGIAPERIFDRFARSSAAHDGGGDSRTGFGIGLALVREGVTRAGGSVSVARTGPDGTAVRMLLPRATAPGADPRPTAQEMP